MTVETYEKDGGFKTEFGLVRDIGCALTTLEEAIPARPHRTPERQALASLRAALDKLREEIARTRDG